MSLNMKRKRRNSQIVNSSIQTRSKTRKLATATATHLDFYLPDECWEHAFKILISDCYDKRACLYLKSLSAVSKQLLSITNRLRLSLTINTQEHPFLPRLLCRFTDLNSLNLTCSASNLNKLLLQLSCFPSNLTSLVLSLQRGMFPADWLQTFHRKKITTLTSLVSSNFTSLDTSYLVLIAYSFPNLQLLDLNDCRYISEEGVAHVLRRCCNIRRLDLSGCSGVMLHGMNFEVPKLKVLDLSHTLVDDKTLYALSESCRGISELLLRNCYRVTEKGVKHVVKYCTQLREINLRRCYVDTNAIVSMILSSPSLRKIIAPDLCYFSDGERELLSCQSCLVC